MLDVDTDQAENGVETMVKVDRDSAARLGITLHRRRQRAVRRLRPAPGRHDLRRTEPVPRDHGMAPALHDRAERAAATCTWSAKTPRRQRGAGAAAAATTTQHRRTTAVSANPALARRVDRQRAGQQRDLAGAALGGREVQRRVDADLDQPPGRRTRDHRLVQPRRRRRRSTTRGREIAQAEADIAMPTNVRGSFAGTALAAQPVARRSRRC